MWKPSFLFSYDSYASYSWDLIEKHRHLLDKTILDSGAYSSFVRGLTIDLDIYIKDALALKKRINLTYMVQLDTINNPKKTLENYRIMKPLGFCPVITLGQNWSKEFDDASLVFCGGVVTASSQSARYHIKSMPDMSKIHLLGINSTPKLLSYKPYSCDSTNNYAFLRFGGVRYYTNGHIVKVEYRDMRHNIGLLKFCRKYNLEKNLYDIIKLYTENPKDIKIIMASRFITLASYYLQAKEVEERYGIKIFFAAASNPFDMLYIEPLQKIKEFL